MAVPSKRVCVFAAVLVVMFVGVLATVQNDGISGVTRYIHAHLYRVKPSNSWISEMGKWLSFVSCFFEMYAAPRTSFETELPLFYYVHFLCFFLVSLILYAFDFRIKILTALTGFHVAFKTTFVPFLNS